MYSQACEFENLRVHSFDCLALECWLLVDLGSGCILLLHRHVKLAQERCLSLFNLLA